MRPSSAKDQNRPDGEDSLGADLTELNMPTSSNDQTWSSDDDDATASTSGMGKEVENLIKENSELLETKNALNIVKNDLIAKIDELSSEQEILREEIRSLETIRTKTNERVKELEVELKETKRQFEEAVKNREDEDGIPMAQRKRFTRIEMARVLTERNQYKEKLMELQEAIRWTEMMRAAKSGDPSLRRKKGSIWEFFSGLFNSSSSSALQGAQNIDLAGIAEQELTSVMPSQGIHQSVTVPPLKGLSDPIVRRKAEKTNPIDFLDTDYYSEKRANERREQYKLVKAHVKKDESGRLQAYGWSIPASGAGQSTIPVPVYSKPLMDQEPNLRIWCATGTLLQGGKKDDGTFINVPFSTAFENPVETTTHVAESTIDHSCLTWICSSAHGQSQVSVVDADNPSEIIDSFNVCSSHLLCIESVSGVMKDDYVTISNPDSLCKAGELRITNAEPNVQVGHTTFVVFSPCEDGITFSGPQKSPRKEKSSSSASPESPRTASPGIPSHKDYELNTQCKETSLPERLKDLLASYKNIELSTACPTVWMGSQNGLHYKGRLFAALANGTVAVFVRESDGEWSTKGYFVILIGKPQHSVRCLKVARGKVWCGYKNSIYIIDPGSLKTEYCFVAHPRKESQVRQLCSVADGVWCSIRLDSTLRLYHAKTYQHLQDIDISPYVTQMIGTSKLGFSFVRITALLITLNRLWIGTGNGVIISVPFVNKSKP
uniref:RH2 domain-containing protein n=1 Tax=Romanomermis culicivorax TaxID=13658 RepID=A0A915IRZ8_ROMCU